jgi:hypothetical protein
MFDYCNHRDALKNALSRLDKTHADIESLKQRQFGDDEWNEYSLDEFKDADVYDEIVVYTDTHALISVHRDVTGFEYKAVPRVDH